MSFKLFKSAATVGSMTAISRVFGLIRDMVLARFFDSASLDLFITAFRIPNFFRALFAEGAFYQAFIPVLAEYKEHRSEQILRAFIAQIAAYLSLVLLILTALGVLFSPFLVSLFGVGFTADRHALTSDLVRITFPYILFISLTAFAGAILNSYKQFLVPALTPVLLNLSLIASVFLLAPLMAEETRIVALAWGVLFAGVVQLLFQLPFLYRLKLLPRARFGRDFSGIKRVLKLMLPILFVASITQINLLFNTMMASFLADGSITWLYFSNRLIEFPMGVFGLALATVILPNLSEQHAKKSTDDFCKMLNWAIKLVLLIMLPAAMGLIVLAQPVLTTLFQYQAFTSYDVLMASQSLMAYAISLPAYALIKVLSASFFSRQDLKAPIKIGIIAVCTNLIMSLLLIGAFAHVGLALAFSATMYLQVWLLFLALKQSTAYQSEQGWRIFLIKVFLSITVMGGVLFFGVADSASWFAWSMIERVLHLLLWLGVGVAVYFASLWLAGIELFSLCRSPKKAR